MSLNKIRQLGVGAISKKGAGCLPPPRAGCRMRLATSFAEARREMPEDLDVEPLELEPLAGDEGL